MIKVNPRPDTLSSDLIEAYRKIAPGTLGHVVEGAMEAAIQAVWKPVKLVGPALTVQTYPQITTAVAQALKVARPGDVLVINRGGDLRHATFGEVATYGALELGLAGIVSDGVLIDQVALRRLKFPAFSRGTTAMTVKTGGMAVEWGAINVPINVGGVVVNPGDLILADDDGVIVASPQEARNWLGFCQEKEAWEEWVRGQYALGRQISELRSERPDPMTKVRF